LKNSGGGRFEHPAVKVASLEGGDAKKKKKLFDHIPKTDRRRDQRRDSRGKGGQEFERGRSC